MPSNNVAISIHNVSKSYTIVHDDHRHVTLAETVLQRLKHPFRRAQRETFWAIQDVSLEIAQGEVVGIIGRNGAGKSTLLKILSRITEPTSGEIHLYGRVGSLLEVGTGFHPELTGSENIFLNGAILGMQRKEIEEQFDAIVDFAGVEKFLDTPVKRYSSGMYVRLAFAVAAHLRSEILLVDEVLAVGDLEFQKKCLGKMKDVASSGRTVLFVSHQMQAVSALCTKAIYLQRGQLEYMGSVSEAIERYMKAPTQAQVTPDSGRRPGSGQLRFSEFVCDKNYYRSTDPIHIDAIIDEVRPGQPRYFVSFVVVNALGVPILHLDSRVLCMDFPATQRRRLRFVISSHRLAQGDYTINAFICTEGGVIDQFDRAAGFSIAPILPYPASRSDCVQMAVVYPDLSIETLDAEEPVIAPIGVGSPQDGEGSDA